MVLSTAPIIARRYRLTIRSFVVALVAGVAIGVTVSALRTEPFGVLVEEGSGPHLMDFASHRGFACAAWSGELAARGGTSIYTLTAHLAATERWSGLPASVAMPFGYSPTMLWVLAPLCVVPARLALVAWSLAGILAAGWMIVRAPVHWTALLALITPLTLYTFAIGQTAVLTTAGLFFLMGAGGERDRPDGAWSEVIVLWLLTAKPQLAVTAGAALLALGRWRSVALAGGLTLPSTVALTPWLGPGWAPDYLQLLGTYDRVGLPPAFAWSIVPDVMSNLRAALHIDLKLADDVAARLSSVAWIVALGAVTFAARRRQLPAWLTWSLVIMAYLILCPHLTATEDLALFCVLVGLARAGVASGVQRGAAALVVGGLMLNPAFGPAQGVRPSLLFFAKLGLAALLLAPGTVRLVRGGRRHARLSLRGQGREWIPADEAPKGLAKNTR